MRTALWWSVVSLLALVVALGVIWLQPEPDRPLRVTFVESGLVDRPTVLCGRLLGVGAGMLRLAVADGGRTTTELVPLADITDLDQVSVC